MTRREKCTEEIKLHLKGTPKLAPHKGAFSKAGSA